MSGKTEVTSPYAFARAVLSSFAMYCAMYALFQLLVNIELVRQGFGLRVAAMNTQFATIAAIFVAITVAGLTYPSLRQARWIDVAKNLFAGLLIVGVTTYLLAHVEGWESKAFVIVDIETSIALVISFVYLFTAAAFLIAFKLLEHFGQN